MRMAFVIVSLAAIAVAVVHLRRQDVAVQSEIVSLEARQVVLRRQVWDRQVQLGELTAPVAVRQRARMLALDVIDRGSDESFADGADEMLRGR
jgi:cell division protein FtsB